MADLTIVIPAYNEADAIGPVLTALAEAMASSGIRHEIVVVDDGSTDGTGRAAQALLGKIPALRVIEHSENRGYGAALKTGILAASAPGGGINDAERAGLRHHRRRRRLPHRAPARPAPAPPRASRRHGRRRAHRRQRAHPAR